MPLFGLVERRSEKERYWHQFSEGGLNGELSVNEDALQFIAAELEVDVDDVVASTWRYINGRYRAKTGGPGADTLGAFGESVALLRARSRNWTFLRVIGSEAAVARGERPQPDFIVRTSKESVVYEVKTSQALDFQNLASACHEKLLRPCVGVSTCRTRALRQLGARRSGTRDPLHHKLLVRSESGLPDVVPYPVAAGVALAVLVRDGRLGRLVDDKRFITPPPCMTRGRDCWRCLGPAEVITVEMHNFFFFLLLPIQPEDDGESWLDAYARWTNAIWLRHADASRAAFKELIRCTERWEAQLQPASINLVERWHKLGSEVLAEHGLSDLEGTAPKAGEFIAHSVASTQVWDSLASAGLGTRWCTQIKPAKEPATKDNSPIQLSIDAMPGRLLIRAQQTPYSLIQQSNLESALATAGEVVAWLAGDTSAGSPLSQSVYPVVAHVDGREVQLGWKFHLPLKYALQGRRLPNQQLQSTVNQDAEIGIIALSDGRMRIDIR